MTADTRKRHRPLTEQKAIYNRAYKRAMARLRQQHHDHFLTLMAEETKWAEQEIDEIRESHNADPVTGQPGGHLHGPTTQGRGGRPPGPEQPLAVPLKPGPRAADDTAPRIREDVGGCPRCAGYHDSGHKCAACGRKPISQIPHRAAPAAAPAAAPDPRIAAFERFNAGTQRAREASR